MIRRERKAKLIACGSWDVLLSGWELGVESVTAYSGALLERRIKERTIKHYGDAA